MGYIFSIVLRNKKKMLPFHRDDSANNSNSNSNSVNSATTNRNTKFQQFIRIFKQVVEANGAMLLRTFSLLGCWALCTSVCTKIGEAHVAAHQIVLSLFCLFSLLAEAPSVAGQVLIARLSTQGKRKEARLLVHRLVRFALATGLLSACLTGLAGLAAPSIFGLAVRQPGSSEMVSSILNTDSIQYH